MIKAITGEKSVLFGIRKSDKRRIFITKPTFDCGWYWGFGYLGNSNEHYRLENYQSIDKCFIDEHKQCQYITIKRNKDMYDCLIEDYDLSENIHPNLWQFCELSSTIYSLKKAAEIFNRGGSHLTTNLGKDYLINEEAYNLLTYTLIPKQCQALWDMIGGNPK